MLSRGTICRREKREYELMAKREYELMAEVTKQ